MIGTVTETFIMSLYRPAAVSEQPDVVLTRWQVFEADRGTMHFVGRDVAAEGRVSSRIVSFDPDTMTGRTRSGRVYRLEGPEGHDPDGLYV